MLNRIIFLIFIVIAACSCGKPAKKQANMYFSLDSFFSAETENMKRSGMVIRKTIQQGDTIESFTDSFPDWQREFSVFRSMDINKTINRDAYEVDTITAAANFRHLLIEAKDYNVSDVQLIDVLYNPGGSIEMLTIHYHNSNAMHDADYRLNYLPGKGYNLSGTSKALASSAHTFDIHAEIGKPGEL